MGYSIDSATYDKLEANRAAGRLCTGATVSGRSCVTRATRKVTTQSFTYKLDEGTPVVHDHTMCARHTQDVGYEGVNFRVLSVDKLR